jgi:hypothetical protein
MQLYPVSNFSQRRKERKDQVCIFIRRIFSDVTLRALRLCEINSEYIAIDK